MATRSFHVSISAAALAACALFQSSHALADGVWHKDLYSALRLIDGGTDAQAADAQAKGVRFAGIEIKLQPGWKTYWRVPGDSGIPPRFDFSGSDNVRDVTVLWPAPHAFADGAGGQSIGYHDHVIFPLKVVPKDPSSPMTIKANIQYAACEKLCVPAEADARLTLTPREEPAGGAVVEMLATVPRKVSPGSGAAIRRIAKDNAGKRILIDIARPPGTAAPPDVFVEGPAPDWAFAIPKPVESESRASDESMVRFAVPLDGAPPGATYDDLEIRVTLSAGARSEETTTVLK